MLFFVVSEDFAITYYLYLFPLYRLENQLVKILDIAFKWKAVVLLDEADVYLEERDTNDLNRNAMTGVFLRQLEYYQGKLEFVLIIAFTSERFFC